MQAISRRLLLRTIILAIAAGSLPLARAAEIPQYTLTEDSLVHEGVPQGKLEGPFEFHSKIIAGTVRRYWIYVPAQYTDASPASVLVFQDGQRAINPAGA